MFSEKNLDVPKIFLLPGDPVIVYDQGKGKTDAVKCNEGGMDKDSSNTFLLA